MPLNKQVDVLIIEDHHDYADMVAGILKSKEAHYEYYVTQASMMVEARKVLREKEFDIVILDLHLPNGAGTDLIREVRQLAPRERTWLIVLTGVVEPAEEIAVRETMANDYLEKKISNRELLLRVRNGAIWMVGIRWERERMKEKLEKIDKRMQETIKVCEDTQSFPPYPPEG